jgi:hypothetical protein
MLAVLFGWIVVGSVITVFIGVGFSVLSMTPPHYTLAQISFTLSALLLLCRTGWWIAFEQSGEVGKIGRGLAAFVLLGLIGMAWVTSVTWVGTLRPIDSKRSQDSHSTLLSSNAQQQVTHYPLSLDFRVSIEKVVMVHNYGREIKDLQLRLTKYNLDRDAFRAGKITISNFSQFGGASLLRVDSLSHGQTSEPLDLYRITFLGFTDKWPTREGSEISPLELAYYALRFTFRDPETGKRFYYCRATSVIKGSPLLPDQPELAGRSGGGNARVFIDDIPVAINEHQKTLYGNGEEQEYKPGTD